MSKGAVIIKKVKKGGHGGHHGGAWKVAYADFVTAMMAFFLVMWCLGLSESTRKDISGYFSKPGVFSVMTGKEINDFKIARAGQSGDASGPNSGMKKDDPRRIATDFPKANCAEKGPSPEEAAKMQELQEAVQKGLQELADGDGGFKDLMEAVTVQVVNEGLRVEMTEANLEFFNAGSAVPNRAAIDVFEKVLAPKLKELNNQIVIEGHTDARTYAKGQKYTNWELSNERANAARRILMESGISDAQIASVTGYAARRLRVADKPTDAANRRVSLLIQYNQAPPETGVSPNQIPGSPGGSPAPKTAPSPSLIEPISPDEIKGAAAPPAKTTGHSTGGH